MDEVGRGGETGLVADAVPADIEHVEGSVGVKDDGIIYRSFVEVALPAGSGKYEFWIFVWSAEGDDFIGTGDGEVRSGEYCCCGSCGITKEAAASAVHHLLSVLKTAIPCVG